MGVVELVDPLRPNVVAAAIRAESGGVLGNTEVLSSLRALQTELTRAGILEPLLCADSTTDVLVTAPDSVWIDDGNGLRRTSIRFADDAAVRRLAQRLALCAGRRLDEAQPWVDGQSTGLHTGQFTVRLHAVLPPIAAGGTCLSLRVLRPASQDLDALTAQGAIAPQAAAELAPRHPHLVKLVARSANIEGVCEVTLRDLVRQALRMRPDRIVVGEVRGAEVVDLLAALNTGHDGGAGTVHANNPAEVPARLEALGALCGLDCAALHSQLAAAVQVVLHVGRELGGRRKLSEIAVLRLVARVRRRLPVVPCAAAIALALALVVPANIVVALAIAGTVALRRRRRLGQQRRAAESAALQGALEVLVGELRVGVHPVAAFGVAAKEVDATVATSLQAVAARARLGADVAGGLRSVAERSTVPARWERLAVCW